LSTTNAVEYVVSIGSGSAPAPAAGIYPPQRDGRFDQQKNFMKMVHQLESDRLFDVRSPDPGVGGQTASLHEVSDEQSPRCDIEFLCKTAHEYSPMFNISQK
jgi:hypothetical protein